MVLIDEFQDTDRVQWEIFSTLFGGRDGDNALVLVGDPKQAIYRFRGADISVYLEAVTSTQAAGRFTLDRNWRSDGAAIEAMGRTFSGATFGNDAIGFVPVRASDEHEPQRMRGPDRSPLSGLAIRVAVGDQLPRSGNFPITPLAARIVHSDMVAHVRNLLDGATIPDPDAAGGERALLPRDIAVLVTSGGHARAAQNALRHQGIPAVVSGAGSVLSSWAADQVRVLLAAMERPADLRRVRAYSLSWFEAWSPRRVATSTDDDLAELQRKLTDWSARLADEPVAEVLAAVWADTDVVARVLGRFDGDRNVTDLDHLAELLHDNAPQGRSGVPGLLAFLDDPPESEGDLETDGDVVARRIESQAEAVQIMTIWKAKGLQFPVVCLPMLWRPGKAPEDVVYTDPETGRRTMDLAKGTNWPDPTRAAARKALAREEEASESLRLVYVALTRAQHHTAVWWANARGSKSRALSRFLFARRPGDGTLDPGVFASGSCTIPPESAIPARLAELAEGTHGTVTVTVVPEPGPESGRAAPWRPPGRQAGRDRHPLGGAGPIRAPLVVLGDHGDRRGRPRRSLRRHRGRPRRGRRDRRGGRRGRATRVQPGRWGRRVADRSAGGNRLRHVRPLGARADRLHVTRSDGRPRGRGRRGVPADRDRPVGTGPRRRGRSGAAGRRTRRRRPEPARAAVRRHRPGRPRSTRPPRRARLRTARGAGGASPRGPGAGGRGPAPPPRRPSAPGLGGSVGRGRARRPLRRRPSRPRRTMHGVPWPAPWASTTTHSRRSSTASPSTATSGPGNALARHPPR